MPSPRGSVWISRRADACIPTSFGPYPRKEPLLMLVLARMRDQSIIIGDDITITVADIRGDKVRLGISAPRNVSVHRKEVYEQIKRETQAAAGLQPGEGAAGVKPPVATAPMTTLPS